MRKSDRFDDPLAAALWQARASRTAIDRAPWEDIPLERADAVAEQLYERLAAGGSRRVGAKVVATDEPTQRRLGAHGPLVAPLYSDAVISADTPVAVGSLLRPVLEGEIGMAVDGDEVVVMPCVEIPDSRFATGAATIAHVAADFGGQALMVFGDPRPLAGVVEVTVTRDGEHVVSASRELDTARSMLDLVRDRWPELGRDEPARVATGTLFAPVPLEPGRWRIDFGTLGMIELDVTE